MDRCDQLAACSEEAGRVTRLFLTPPMHDVHERLRRWMVDVGMKVRIDPVGNIVGRRLASDSQTTDLQATDLQATRVLLIGSHLDTVPNAGKYDGILGVLVGLAVVEALATVSLPFAIDVIGFSEEEGVRYSQPYLGSRAVAGNFDFAWLDRCDAAGISMREAVASFGQDSSKIADAAYNAADVVGYIEAHIEQGPVLERAGLPVAAVTSIVGQSRLVVRFLGAAGHAGTTPMVPRRDALVGAAKWIQEVQQTGVRTEGLRATVGRIIALPNASNVIPDYVELSLDVRHESNSIRLAAIDGLLDAGCQIAKSDDLEFSVAHRSDSRSVAVSPRLESILCESIAASGVEPLRLASGAGHDAVVMGEQFPMAMLFVRHPGGTSHHPDERVDVEDVAVAIDVMVDFVKRLADQERVE